MGKGILWFLQNGSCVYSFELPRTLVIITFVRKELGLVLAKVNLSFKKRLAVVSAVEQFRGVVYHMECHNRFITWSITWNVIIGLRCGLLHECHHGSTTWYITQNVVIGLQHGLLHGMSS